VENIIEKSYETNDHIILGDGAGAYTELELW